MPASGPVAERTANQESVAPSASPRCVESEESNQRHDHK